MEQVDPRDRRIAELESQVCILTEQVKKLLIENAALRAENVALPLLPVVGTSSAVK